MIAALSPGRPFTGGERELLEDTLELYRAEIVTAVEGLSDAQARQNRVPSLTTPISLIKHGAAAERIWFQRTLYFDFGIYGYLATVLSVEFFASSTNPTTALLATFATFAAAFALRPLGGLIFGHFGDMLGRAKMLAFTIIAMCLATFAVGVLPTYAAIGTAAAFLLVIARCVQGLASGGEVGGAATYVAECSPDHRRGFFCSTVQLGALGGALIASAVVTGLTGVLSSQQLHDWGWRLPFLLSLPLGVVGVWIRLRLEDAPQFEAVKQQEKVAKAPAMELFADHRAALLRTIGLSTLLFSAYYVIYVYAAVHLQRVGGFTPHQAFWSTTLTLIASCAAMPAFGALSDRIGRRPMFLGAAAAFVVLTIPGFMAMDSGHYGMAVVAQVILGIPESALMAVAFSTFAELFTVRVRYSGIALGFNLASMTVGGTAPFISVWLLDVTGSNLAPAGFLIATALVTLATALTLQETRGSALRGGEHHYAEPPVPQPRETDGQPDAAHIAWSARYYLRRQSLLVIKSMILDGTLQPGQRHTDK